MEGSNFENIVAVEGKPWGSNGSPLTETTKCKTKADCINLNCICNFGTCLCDKRASINAKNDVNDMVVEELKGKDLKN